jgi:sRNA-binding regulator protein Hfq
MEAGAFACGDNPLIDTTLPSRKVDTAAFNGTRKLVRPQLPPGDRRRDPIHTEDPLSHAMTEPQATLESTHAEVFYFQKQMQQQTELTVVMDDGEEFRGVLEWYDKCALKMRTGRNRVLIYKEGIKYLYKSSEGHPVASVMR